MSTSSNILICSNGQRCNTQVVGPCEGTLAWIDSLNGHVNDSHVEHGETRGKNLRIRGTGNVRTSTTMKD